MPFLRKNITISGGLDERENQCGGGGRRGEFGGRQAAQSTHFMISESPGELIHPQQKF